MHLFNAYINMYNVNFRLLKSFVNYSVNDILTIIYACTEFVIMK